MTNTEIIEKLKGYKGIIMYPTEEAEALKDAAIQALSQEPCDDVISREAAIIIAGTHTLTVDETIKALEQLPSVTQKSGKWIGIDEEPHEDYECSCCGYVVSTFTANIEPHTEYKYCPNCGAKMESEEQTDVT